MRRSSPVSQSRSTSRRPVPDFRSGRLAARCVAVEATRMRQDVVHLPEPLFCHTAARAGLPEHDRWDTWGSRSDLARLDRITEEALEAAITSDADADIPTPCLSAHLRPSRRLPSVSPAVRDPRGNHYGPLEQDRTPDPRTHHRLLVVAGSPKG